jgi:hypothetical protein
MWQRLADAVNVILRNKLKEPLTGADMVQVITAWRELAKSCNKN